MRAPAQAPPRRRRRPRAATPRARATVSRPSRSSSPASTASRAVRTADNRTADAPRARNGGPYVLFDSLGPDTELLNARAAARWAHLRRSRLAATAPVAHERTIDVVRVRDLARRALRHVAAIAAEHHGRKAAAIQIEDRLFARGDGPLERLAQRLRQGAAIAGPELETQIDHRRWRQRQLPDALRQRERRDLAFPRRLVRDDARCRASQHDGGSGEATELERGVDRVVARVALLLVRRLLLLVDDDQTEALERREERGARADDRVGDSVGDPSP